MKKTLSYIAIILVAFVIAANIAGYIQRDKTPEANGYVIDVEAFKSNCASEAVKNNASQSEADQYCTCVYYKGVQEYGGEKWTEELAKLEQTGTFTPFMNTAVNSCISSTNRSTI